jgi:uncharacterized phage protein gp47/JayE
MNNIPTLAQIFNSIIADLESELNISIPLFGRNFLRALAAVLAGKQYLQYLLIAKVQKNIFVDTAEPESSGGTLERFGRIKIGRNPFPAQPGYYILNVTGSTGATIAAQTTFKSDDDSTSPGKLFILDSSYTMTGSGDQITVRALEAGLDSKLSVSDTLTATAPIALVDSEAVVSSEQTQPQAAENIETYRAAVEQSFRLEPQGGAHADYRLWASEVQSVQQSYPNTGNATNEIDLYVEATVADSTDGKGTPSTQILQDVEDVIELPTTTQPARRPMNDIVNYLAITPLDIDITITGFVDLTTEKQTAIENAIEVAINNIRPFIGAIDVVAEKNDILDNNKLINVILNVLPGSVFTSISFDVDGSPQTTYQFTDGDIPFYNSITFV